jgi:hypothetical protein
MCNDKKAVLVNLLEAAALAAYVPLAKAMMKSCYKKANCISDALQTTYNHIAECNSPQSSTEKMDQSGSQNRVLSSSSKGCMPRQMSV